MYLFFVLFSCFGVSFGFVYPHTAELAGIIVAAALVTAAIVAIAVWLHFRRKKSKSQALNVELSHHPQTVQTQFNLGFVMETETKTMGIFFFFF